MSFRLRARHRPRVRELRAGPSFDEAAWQASEPALEGPGQVSLHGLSLRAAAEMLYGLQQRTRSGTATSPGELRQIAWELRCTGAAGIGGIAGGDRTQHRLARSLARHAAADVASQSEPTIILVYDSATLV
jgi:hypothetical protein